LETRPPIQPSQVQDVFFLSKDELLLVEVCCLLGETLALVGKRLQVTTRVTDTSCICHLAETIAVALTEPMEPCICWSPAEGGGLLVLHYHDVHRRQSGTHR